MTFKRIQLESDKQTVGSTSPLPVSQYTDGNSVSVQNPLPTDGDSVYVKDLDLPLCDNGDFNPLTGYEGTGDVTDYFNSLITANTNITSNNPKIITLHFKRSVQTSRIGFGCDDPTKNFGSIGDTITIKVFGSGDTIRTETTKTITNGNSFVVGFEPETANGCIIEFNTANEVTLSNLIIYKSVNTNATIQIQKPDGTIVEAQGTAQGNFKTSMEEYDPTFLDSPLPITKGFNIPIYDDISLTYVASGNGIGEIETVVYKNSSVVVATLTLSYDASNKLSGVVHT